MVRIASAVVLTLAILIGPASSATHRMVPGVPKYAATPSSHAAAAASVVTFLGATKDDPRPAVALLGDLEAKMFRCDCGQKIYLWEVRQGIERWALARGWTATVTEGCLRSNHPEEVVKLDAIRAEPSRGIHQRP